MGFRSVYELGVSKRLGGGEPSEVMVSKDTDVFKGPYSQVTSQSLSLFSVRRKIRQAISLCLLTSSMSQER